MPYRRTGYSKSRGISRRRSGSKGRRRLQKVTYGQAARAVSGFGSAAYTAYRGGYMPKVAVKGSSRRKFAGRTTTRKRRGGSNTVIGGELTTARRRMGRYKKLTVNKLREMAASSAILRYQGINRYGALAATAIDEGLQEAVGNPDLTTSGVTNAGYPGYFVLNNAVASDAVSTTGDTFPLHICCLNSVPNASLTTNHMQELTTGNTATADVTDMLFNASTIALGQTPEGGTSSRWNYEKLVSPGSFTDPIPGSRIDFFIKSKYIQHMWYEMRFLLYGQRQSPTIYDVMLVKFRDECLAPELTAAQIAALPSEQRQSRNALWQGLVRNISYNPILPAAPKAFSGLRVIKRQRFIIQASMTDEADRTPHHKIVKWFYKAGVNQDYDYSSLGQARASTIDAANYTQQIAVSNMQNVPHPKARLYLMIRATNTTPAAAQEDMDNTPSYDLCIRKKIYFQGIAPP